jgi:molybdate transport system permease protein
MIELSPDEWVAIRLSLRIALVATVVALPLGLAVAWLLARKHFYGKALLDGLIHLPLVLPPVVTGYLLLISFGRRGPIGAFLADYFGLVFSFRWSSRSRRSTASSKMRLRPSVPTVCGFSSASRCHSRFPD